MDLWSFIAALVLEEPEPSFCATFVSTERLPKGWSFRRVVWNKIDFTDKFREFARRYEIKDLACSYFYKKEIALQLVDVFADTASIRNERANMVDNKQQYLLAHLALVECLLSIPTTLPCNETLPARIKELKAQLPAQQQRFWCNYFFFFFALIYE